MANVLGLVISPHRTIARCLPGSETEELPVSVGLFFSVWGIIREKVMKEVMDYTLVCIYERLNFPN